MTGEIDAHTLKSWLSDGAEIALLDVREAGQFGEAHPFFAVPLPYSRFELGLRALIPNPAARIVLCDPHRAIVAGPSRMHGASMISPDIRAGMAMLLAAVCAEGVSTINNADQIERGYERIDERLNSLGAKITRVPARAG